MDDEPSSEQDGRAAGIGAPSAGSSGAHPALDAGSDEVDPYGSTVDAGALPGSGGSPRHAASRTLTAPSTSSASAPARLEIDPPAGDLFPGARVGRFILRAELGRGGMGVVYLAEDPSLDREVALKVLRCDDPARRKRFQREARAVAALSDPGIAAIYEVGEDGGISFIAMERIHGRSLRALLKGRPLSGRALSAAEALRISRAVASALAKAHHRGIIHRDLKPENIMIADDGQVKLLDFGIAKAADTGARPKDGAATTEKGQILGTPSYMSPEQTTGRSVDVRSDIFSFGVMLYEMLTGERPFSGDSLVALFVAIGRETPPPPSRKNPAVPPALERVTLRCLQKDPASRYADAAELLRDLERIPEESARARPKRWALWSVPAVLLVAAGAAINALGISGGSRAPLRQEAAIAPAPFVAAIPTAITDLPMPPHPNADAAAVYRRGLAGFRAGDSALDDFARAAELDPSFGPAYVQLIALGMVRSTPELRDQFRRADELRSSLSERDQSLLDAMEPVVRRQTADWPAALARFDKLVERWPGDAQLWFLRGQAHAYYDSFAEAIKDMGRAVELDPKFAGAYSLIGPSEAYLGRFADARRSLERCLEVAPASMSCLYWLAKLAEHEGDCEGMEGVARRMIATGARAPQAYSLLARALAAQHQPLPTVREAVRQSEEEIDARSSSIGRAGRSETAVVNALRLATLEGDFVAAERYARDLQEIVGSSKLRDDHGSAAHSLAHILAEMGRLGEAGEVAMAFLSKRDAWEPDPTADDIAMGYDAVPSLLLMARQAGKLSAPEFAAEREAWQRAWSARASPVARAYLWLHGQAGMVDNPDAARAALEALPPGDPIPPFRFEKRPIELAAGRTLLLGGRTEEAVAMLTHATRRCNVLMFPMEHTRAYYWLGRALAEKGDSPSACAAYHVVIERWGRAKPRSVTLDAAKDRAREIRCPAIEPRARHP